MVKAVSDFFKIPEELNRTAQLSDKIRSVAYSRIEEAKQRTKEELRKNITSLLESAAGGNPSDVTTTGIIFVHPYFLSKIIHLKKYHKTP